MNINLLFITSITINTLAINSKFGLKSPFYKIMVIRGIGYRAYYVKNDYISTNTYNSQNFLRKTLYVENIHIPVSETDEFESHYLNLDNLTLEFKYNRYLIIRAGHTGDLYLPLNSQVRVRIVKKDRKLIISSPNKQEIGSLARKIFEYRKPSPYTGRGVRRKHLRVIRKAGKRDSKGR